MAKVEFGGIDEYAKKLGELWKDERKIIESAVYEGAGIVADEIKEGLKGIPIQEGKNGLPPRGDSKNKLTGISRKQKQDLIAGFGLSPMEDSGDFINTKAGFEGYGSIKTKKYPKGTPNAMLMRSVESGTSFREKRPTVRPAVNRAKKRAQEAMEKELDKQIKERME